MTGYQENSTETPLERKNERAQHMFFIRTFLKKRLRHRIYPSVRFSE